MLGGVLSTLRAAVLAAVSVLTLSFAIMPVAAGAFSPIVATTRAGGAPGSERLRLVLPLVAETTALRRFALAVTTPGSPDYAQYESVAQLARRFGASARTGERVVRFLRAAGATHVGIDATGLFADATVSVSVARHLFAPSLMQFRTVQGVRFTAPSSAVTIPEGLRGLITGVVGLNTEPIVSDPSPSPEHVSVPAITENAVQQSSGYHPATGRPGGCAAALATGAFTPEQYLTAYGYNALHELGDDGQGERVAVIEIVGFNPSDISTFARCFRLRLPTINRVGVGLRKPLAPGGESIVDLEALDAAAPGLKAIDVYEASPDTADTLLALTAPLQRSRQKPGVISASLGLCEQFTQSTVGKSGLAAAEGALEELAASGITFLAASGDDGSADCIPGPTMLPQSALPERAVDYPASSPWATGVGGTNLQLNAQNQITSQVVWNDAAAAPGLAGGGGASQIFRRPSYQKATVVANVRAVPDVSMLADSAPGYAVYCSASPDCVNSGDTNPWQSVGGTSVATPLLAGGFALVDQVLRKHGRQDLGLANPLLYQLGRSASLAPSVFNDVTRGSNDVGSFIGAGSPLGCCSAKIGFDEASGWGSVNMAGFSRAASALQPKIANITVSLPKGQHPAQTKHITATVSCTEACLLEAVVKISIGNAKPFTVDSRVYHLRKSGWKTVKIGFSTRQLTKLRSGVVAHARIVAKIIGEVVDGAGSIERHSVIRKLEISS
jgi:kumamolisin